jgi:hypothetical protein
VQDYIDTSSELVDQSRAYNHTIDPLYYTTKFVDALLDDIRTIVVVQCPPNLDTTCCLALLQEEHAASASIGFRKYDNQLSCPGSKGAFPLPRPQEAPNPIS